MDSPGTRFREHRKSDRFRTVVFVAIACLAVVGMALWLGRTSPLLVLGGVVLILGLLVYWHSRTNGYRCPGCGAEFAISAWADFLSPQTLTSKYVKCPVCGRRAWMEGLVRIC